MNIFYWKGQTASVPSATSGTTYTTWAAATNVGLTANWVMAFSNLTSLIVGATRLPGPLDYVYIQDKYPNIGSTYSGWIETTLLGRIISLLIISLSACDTIDPG